MQEKADFDERKRMAKVELLGADASRKELNEMQSKIDTEMVRLNALREQLQCQTRALLEKEASVDAKLGQVQHLEARNEQTVKDLRAAKDEHERASARLQEREERLLHSSLDAMKHRYYLQKSAGAAQNGKACSSTGIDGTSKYMYPPLSAGGGYCGATMRMSSNTVSS